MKFFFDGDDKKVAYAALLALMKLETAATGKPPAKKKCQPWDVIGIEFDDDIQEVQEQKCYSESEGEELRHYLDTRLLPKQGIHWIGGG